MNILHKLKRKLYKVQHPVIGDVLMLHRVVQNRSNLEENRRMEILPRRLENLISYYKHLQYDILSIEELYQRYIRGELYKRKFVCFTFDDGYVDNYNVAFPIFRKYNCPFTVFVTTDFPEGKAFLWWYVLEKILLTNNEVMLGDGSRYVCNTIESKNNAFRLIREKIFKLQHDNLNQQLINLFHNYHFSAVEIVKQNALTWAQIREMSESALCSIASHSVSHVALDRLTRSEAEIELTLSKQLIEKHVNKQVDHFAYPYGRHTHDLFEVVRATGYVTSCIANGGRERNDMNLYAIRRTQVVD